MLQQACTDLFNPLVPKPHNSECQSLQFPLQIKPQKPNKASLQILFFAPSALMGLPVPANLLVFQRGEKGPKSLCFPFPKSSISPCMCVCVCLCLFEMYTFLFVSRVLQKGGGEKSDNGLSSNRRQVFVDS